MLLSYDTPEDPLKLYYIFSHNNTQSTSPEESQRLERCFSDTYGPNTHEQCDHGYYTKLLYRYHLMSKFSIA